VDRRTHRDPLDGFVDWTAHVPRLANPPDVVRWNSDKTYLRDLADAGIAIVPTQWLEPGRPVALPIAGEFVVKPSVGAGSRGAGRFTAAAGEAAIAHAAALHDAGRIVLLQPYLADVDTAGETALIYLAGVFSHAIRKGAMLPPGALNPLDRTHQGGLYVEERISAHHATPEERAVGERVMAYLRNRFGGDQLYARVDLLPSPDGPVIVELELVEPSLFLGHDAGAADRFAAVIAERV
jgi:glutathione synthase/RimK-type ligase-like ATP-grasp enzyme